MAGNYRDRVGLVAPKHLATNGPPDHGISPPPLEGVWMSDIEKTPWLKPAADSPLQLAQGRERVDPKHKESPGFEHAIHFLQNLLRCLRMVHDIDADDQVIDGRVEWQPFPLSNDVSHACPNFLQVTPQRRVIRLEFESRQGIQAVHSVNPIREMSSQKTQTEATDSHLKRSGKPLLPRQSPQGTGNSRVLSQLVENARNITGVLGPAFQLHPLGIFRFLRGSTHVRPAVCSIVHTAVKRGRSRHEP